MARILDGREHGKAWRAELAEALAQLKGRGLAPTVAVVRVGEDESSVSYAKQIARTLEAAGVELRLEVLAEDTPEPAVQALLEALSADPGVHGILLQEPLPGALSAERLALAIAPRKDLDGVHPVNAGDLFQGRAEGLVPATPRGGMELLEREGVAFTGQHAVVIGRSSIVGRPMALLLLHRHATVTLCHSRTQDLPALARQADILVAAVGRAGFVTPDWVKPGAVVVDFGINFVDGKLCGDVDPAAAEVAGAFTPTPGGTGAMTNAALLANLVQAMDGA